MIYPQKLKAVQMNSNSWAIMKWKRSEQIIIKIKVKKKKFKTKRLHFHPKGHFKKIENEMTSSVKPSNVKSEFNQWFFFYLLRRRLFVCLFVPFVVWLLLPSPFVSLNKIHSEIERIHHSILSRYLRLSARSIELGVSFV